MGSSHQKISYLRNTGHSYIDTGIVPDGDTGIRIKMQAADVTDNYVVGLRDTTGDTRWGVGNKGDVYFLYGIFGSYQWLPVVTADAIVELNYLNSKRWRAWSSWTDGSVDLILPTLSFTPRNNIRLFGSSGVVASYSTWKGSLYYVQITQGSKVVMDLIPVRIGVTGYMYDQVSGRLFGNAGSGEFVLGYDIN